MPWYQKFWKFFFDFFTSVGQTVDKTFRLSTDFLRGTKIALTPLKTRWCILSICTTRPIGCTPTNTLQYPGPTPYTSWEQSVWLFIGQHQVRQNQVILMPGGLPIRTPRTNRVWRYSPLPQGGKTIMPHAGMVGNMLVTGSQGPDTQTTSGILTTLPHHGIFTALMSAGFTSINILLCTFLDAFWTKEGTGIITTNWNIVSLAPAKLMNSGSAIGYM